VPALTDAQKKDLADIEKNMHASARKYLQEPDAAALAHTIHKIASREYEAGGNETDVTTKMIVASGVFRNLPAGSDPASPFHTADSSNAPIPTTRASAPAPQPSVAPNASPPIDVSDPDAITVTGDDGTVIQNRPDGEGGRVTIESTVDPSSYGGGNNNKGNSGRDDGPKDKDPGGKNNSNGGGGGNGHHGP
jgi:hypothetical protein